MRAKLKDKSLECYFRKQATRWALIGFALTLVFSIPCILFSAKVASERQLRSTAKSTVRVFREMILQENIREAEFQMQNSLDLGPLESATVFDPDLNAIYPLKETNKSSHCESSEMVCWSKGFRTLSVLQPIYFNDKSKEGLFGYLELTLVPVLDLSILSILFVLLLIAFVVQAFGLSSALNQSAKQIVAQLSLWATHLRTAPGTAPAERQETRQQVPFSELKTMQEAVDGLYFEIDKLREKTAKEAKTAAQAVILREIGHDLKTPHSLLAKYFALLVDTVRTTGQINEIEVGNVERTLKRMGQLLRNVLLFSFGNTTQKDPDSAIPMSRDIRLETESILFDLRSDPNVLTKQIDIILNTELLPSIQISRLGYYRLLENLVRNAIESVPPEGGQIWVELKTVNGSPTLLIRDNGSGISPEIIDKIFDFDFTTKPERGTGLGLGIVQKICHEFQIKIAVESAVNQGTQFTLTFLSALSNGAQPQDIEVTYGKI